MILIAETNYPLYIFAAGVALAVSILLRRSRKYFSRTARWQREKQEQPATMIEPMRRAASVSNLDKSPQVQRWEVEMHELARELAAQLDSKMVALQHLLRDAEAAIQKLSTLTNQRAAFATTVETESVPPVAVPTSPPTPESQRPALLPSPADVFHAAYRHEVT